MRIDHHVRTKSERRERKRKPNMKVSGAQVKKLRDLIVRRSRSS